MKRILSANIAAVTLALAFCAQIAAANAGPQVVLCASARAQAGSSAVGTISLTHLSQSYAADPSGCVVAANLADAAIFRANGYSEPGKERSVLFTTGVQTGATSFLIGQIPPGAYLQQIVFANSTANSAGNLTFGTTSGGSDIVAAVACGANCLAALTLLKTVLSTTAPQQIYVTSSAWGSASLNVT